MALALRKSIKQKKVNEKDTLNSKKIKTSQREREREKEERRYTPLSVLLELKAEGISEGKL